MNLKETAAAGSTSAGDVAGGHGSLFGGGLVDLEQTKKKKRKMMRRLSSIYVNEAINNEENFNAADVIAKLDAAEKKANTEDTVPFGLEDEEGNIIKVYVKAEQAEEFEDALASLLAGNDENDDDENTPSEIAEILFNLKDKFDIIDVDWGVIEGDEQEEMEDPNALGSEEDPNAMGDEELGLEDEGALADEEAAKSALQQVIDMMKADADAKKAEAEARTAEARAKEAETAARVAAVKVKQEEEILDMETHEKRQKEEAKEAQQLAKLAKYKHDQANAAETTLASEQEEENRIPPITDEISKEELSKMILKHLKAQ